MKRIYTLILVLLALASAAIAAGPWKMVLTDETDGIKLHIDLYEESVDVPGMDMFGPMNGYIAGKGVWGTWMITSFTIDSDNQATLRLSNDQGSETQKVRLTQQSDSTYMMELQGGVVVKKVVNKKLEKLPAKILLNVKR